MIQNLSQAPKNLFQNIQSLKDWRPKARGSLRILKRKKLSSLSLLKISALSPSPSPPASWSSSATLSVELLYSLPGRWEEKGQNYSPYPDYFPQGWTYLDGAYFCFISLMTIGFGDFVPGNSYIYNVADNMSEQEANAKLVLGSVYLLLGMGIIAMCVNLMQEKIFTQVWSVL